MHAFNRYNLSYHYDTANIIILIIKNFLKGPDFFINDISTLKIREYIKNKYKIEVLKHIEVNKNDTYFIENTNYSFFKKVLIFISLNGHLFPYSLLDKKNYYIDKFNECNVVRISFKKSFTVYDEINRKGYKLTRNCYYFFKNIIIMIFYTFLFLLKYSFVKRKYLSFYKKLTNGAFWRKLYKQNKINQ